LGKNNVTDAWYKVCEGAVGVNVEVVVMVTPPPLRGGGGVYCRTQIFQSGGSCSGLLGIHWELGSYKPGSKVLFEQPAMERRRKGATKSQSQKEVMGIRQRSMPWNARLPSRR